MDILVLVGRLLFASIFLASAVGHFAQREMMSGYATSKGVPAFLVPVTGIQLGVGALMVAFGIWPDLGALLLFLFLVPTAFLMHAFWKETDPAAKSMEQIQFLKELALAGAALALFAFFARYGNELGFVLVGPVFRL